MDPYAKQLMPVLERQLELTRVLIAMCEWSEREQRLLDAEYLQFIDAMFSELHDLYIRARALRHARPPLALVPSPTPTEPDEPDERRAG